MSNKGIEEIPEKKVNLLNMSERQALLYFQHGGGDEDGKTEKCNALLDYHQYFLYKKEQQQATIEKSKIAERNKLKKQSLKEFTQIKKNIYIDRKKYVFTDDEGYVCNCFPRKYTQSEAKRIIESGYEGKTEEELFGCGRSCINKMVYWECVEHQCPCGASCRNRKFQNHEYADVYPIKTEDRGYGLCAGTFLPKGTFVIQYIGEVYSIDSEYGQKKLNEYKNSTCTYLMSLSKNEVIDPTTKGNFARFINHSCEPNCETQKWHVLGEICVGIFTLRDIQPDEELTFNYGFNIAKTVYQKCLCGAPTCRGYLGIVQSEDPKKGITSVNCDACHQHCKSSDCILICESCKRIYHKKCAKKGKGNNRNFTCYHCLKKSLVKKQSVEAASKEKVVKIEEEPVYDENYEVGDEELGKIRKNLSQLINCGARLFWDYQLQNSILGTSNKLEIKITGTPTQIENVKKMIKQLKETKKEPNNDIYVSKLQVPKIFVRKIIGHQNRNLNSYKSKFNVDVEYDMSLITDEIFPLQESTFIQIKGKENNVRAVENDIKSYLYNLKVLTIFLMPTDYQYIRANICELKTKIDPADVRLRKREYKGERDLKHPFYYIPNNNKDIVIIGFDREVERGEKRIKEQILRQNSLLYNYSLTFLFSNYFGKQLNAFIMDNKNNIRDKKLYLDVVKPESPRKHLCIYVEGKWKDIIELKNTIWRELKDLNAPDYFSNINLRKHNVTGFEQYAFNQEHKLTSKSIKAYLIEQNPQIKNWDTISVDISNISKETPKQNSIEPSAQKGKAETPHIIKNFVTNSDKETRVNYLLSFEPGSYHTIFNQSQSDLANELFATFNDVYESYKESRNTSNVSAYTSSYNDVVSDNDVVMKEENKNESIKEEQQQQPQKVEKTDTTTQPAITNQSITVASTNPLTTLTQLMPVLSQKNAVIEEQPKPEQDNNGINNISYNFSNINHMNINININEHKSFLNNEQQTTPSLNYPHQIEPQKVTTPDTPSNPADTPKLLSHKSKRSKSRNSSHHSHTHHHYRPSNKNYYFDKHRDPPINQYPPYEPPSPHYSRSPSPTQKFAYSSYPGKPYYQSQNSYYNMSDGYNYKNYPNSYYKYNNNKRYYDDSRYNSRNKGYYSKSGYPRKYREHSLSRSKSRSNERRYTSYPKSNDKEEKGNDQNMLR